jgi:diguanylate cyclase (GGDEF)-like protein
MSSSLTGPAMKIVGLSISHKLAIVLLATTLLAIIITGASYHFRSQHELMLVINKHLKSVSRQQTHQVLQTITSNKEKIALITSRTQLRLSLDKWLQTRGQGLPADPDNVAKMQQILVDASLALPDILSLTLSDPLGEIIASTRQGNKDTFLPKRYVDAVTADLDSRVFFEPVSVSKYKMVLLQNLILEGKVLGVLSMETDLSAFENVLLTHKGLGITEEAFLVYKDPLGKLRPLTPLKQADMLDVVTRIDPFIRHQADDIRSVQDYRGKSVFAISHAFEGINLGLVFKIDKEDALQVIDQQSGFLLVSLLAATVVVLVIAVLLGQSITKPVIDLVYVATLIAQGDLSRRIEHMPKDELGLLAVAFNQMADKLIEANQYLEQKINVRTKELLRANAHLQKMGQTLERLSLEDELTGIANRRAFDQLLASEWQRCQRNHTPLALLLLDIDFFKQYNDSLGHQAGDQCLRQVAQLLHQYGQRGGDLVARYGGEEFVVLLPNTTLTDSLKIAQRIHQTLAQQALPHPNSKIGTCVTVSIGVGVISPAPRLDSHDFIASVDAALYRAKKLGRNRTEIARFEVTT